GDGAELRLAPFPALEVRGEHVDRAVPRLHPRQEHVPVAPGTGATQGNEPPLLNGSAGQEGIAEIVAPPPPLRGSEQTRDPERPFEFLHLAATMHLLKPDHLEAAERRGGAGQVATAVDPHSAVDVE